MNMKAISINFLLATLLLLCLFNWNYGFYQLVRFIGFVGFSVLAFNLKDKKDYWFYIWLFSALLINPFFKVSLGRTIWNFIDVIWAVLLAINVFGYFKENEANKKLISSKKEEFNFKEAIFKYYLEQDFFTFHYFGKFDMINYRFVNNYDDLFNSEKEGITTFFNVQQPDKLSYKDYFGRDYSRLKNNSLFAVFIFDYMSTFSTNSVSGIQSLSFNKIEVYRKTSDNNVSLVDICNVDDLRNKTV